MAITIQSYPIGGQNVTMAHNPIEYVVSSTNKTQTNFKYIADLYWLGATEPVRFTMGVEPTYGNCRFDFSSIMRNLVTSDPPTFINDFQPCTNSYQTLTVKFGEQYGASSALTNYLNLATHTMKVWNASLSVSDWWNNNNPVTAYAIKNNLRKFLTNVPRGTQANGVKVCYNDLHYLYLHQDGTSNDIGFVEIKLYKGASLHSTVTWDCATTKTTPVLRVGVGAKNLQEASTYQTELNITSTFGFPFMDTDVTTYSVQIIDAGLKPLTELMWFKIECECTWETPYRLCFLNKLGGYDFFNFNWNSKKTSSYKKTDYERKMWEWNNTGTAILYNSKSRGKTQYSTIITDKLQLTSGWLTEDESTWLEELIASPDVYIINNTTGQLTAVTVTDSQYDYKTLEYDQLFNLTVNLEFAYTRFSQSL